MSGVNGRRGAGRRGGRFADELKYLALIAETIEILLLSTSQRPLEYKIGVASRKTTVENCLPFETKS